MFFEEGLNPSGGGPNSGPCLGCPDKVPVIRIATVMSMVVFMVVLS
jgi:hypothetical protein